MPPKGDPTKQKEVTGITEITEAATGGTSSRKGYQDLTVRARKEAENLNIAYPSETRETTKAVLNKSFFDYLKKMCCDGQSSDDEVSDSKGTQLQSNVSFGKKKFRETSTSTQEIELVRMKTESLKDAQRYIWEGHLSKEEVGDLMMEDKVISCELSKKGTSGARIVTLESGIVGIFKSEILSADCKEYENEIAAYQVDQLLGLQMVPLTVLRKINGKQGSLQLLVNNLDETARTDMPLPANAQFFDLLINSWDCPSHDRPRHMGHNSGRLADNPDHVVLFDNALSFDQPYPLSNERYKSWEVVI